MARDFRKLRVFVLADELAVDVYEASKEFPLTERFGLQSQLRRAAVSVPCNIVEGSARRSTRDFLYFLNVSAGSAAEARYLIDLAARLGYLSATVRDNLIARYTIVCAQLQTLMQSLRPKT